MTSLGHAPGLPEENSSAAVVVLAVSKTRRQEGRRFWIRGNSKKGTRALLPVSNNNRSTRTTFATLVLMIVLLSTLVLSNSVTFAHAGAVTTTAAAPTTLTASSASINASFDDDSNNNSLSIMGAKGGITQLSPSTTSGGGGGGVQFDECLAPVKQGGVGGGLATADPRPPALEQQLADCRINQKFEQLKSSGLDLGQPTTTTTATASQKGAGVYYKDYERQQFVTLDGQEGGSGGSSSINIIINNNTMKGSIYFIPGRGTFEIHGDILQKYDEKGREDGFLGLPTEDTRALPENAGLVQVFDGGVIYWSPNTGAHELHNGPILDRYASMGWEKSPLGFPTTDEGPALREGKYNHFQNGAIYWAPELDNNNNNAYAVYGPIYEKWKSMGWERSELGYPVSDTGAPPIPDPDLHTSSDMAPAASSGSSGGGSSSGDQYTRFQHGAISWSASKGVAYVFLQPHKFAVTFNNLHVYYSHDTFGCANWYFGAYVNEYSYLVLDNFCVDQDNTYRLAPTPAMVVEVPRDGKLHISTNGVDEDEHWYTAEFSDRVGLFEGIAGEDLGTIDLTFTDKDNWGLNHGTYGYYQIDSTLGSEYTDYWADLFGTVIPS
jgi:hypothetical protein